MRDLAHHLLGAPNPALTTGKQLRYPNMATRAAYERFHAWAVAEGFNRDKLPAINGFVQRVLANAAGIESKRMNYGRVFLGFTIKHENAADHSPYYNMVSDA